MSEDGDKKAKPGLMRRWFGGSAAPAEAEAPTAPRQAPEAIAEPAPLLPGRPAARAEAELAPAAEVRSRPLVLEHRPRHRRHFHQAQARRRLARRPRRRPDPGRPRSRRGDPHPPDDRAGALREGHRCGRGPGGAGRRGRAHARARGAPARGRPEQEAVRRSRRRRQRLGQDDDHRQARREIQGRGADGHSGRGRHVPRRRDRAGARLGEAHRLGPRRSATRAATRRASPSTR